MKIILLTLTVGLFWINLLGAGLVAWRLTGNYAIGRISGVVFPSLALFFLEHYVAIGPSPPLLPVTTILSLWLVWRHRAVVCEHWETEVMFVAGFLYCLMWRYSFPDIDFESERMPNLAFIDGYMKGELLPAPDRWLWPYRADFYYSFQHYCAALLGRLMGIGPGESYNLGYCVLVSLIVGAISATAVRLCPSRVMRWIPLAALIVGGSGAALCVRLLVNGSAFYSSSVRFLGVAMTDGKLNEFGQWVSAAMSTPGVQPRDLPLEPFSYVIVHGDFHPPLAGHLLLAFACLIIAVLENDTGVRDRRSLHAMLAATVPVTLIANAWVYPLQVLLVGGWFVYRVIRRERSCLLPAILGVMAAAILVYPHLKSFALATSAKYAAIRFVESIDHTPLLGWLMIFWPVAGILILSCWNRERRGFAVYLLVTWSLVLAVTEFLYDDDLFGGQWSRFNTTLKWWPWAYAGIVLTVGSLNLNAASKFCRYGTMILLLPTCIFAVDLGRRFVNTERRSLGNLGGAGWTQRDPVIADLIAILGSRPDGVTLESGLEMTNTSSPAVTLFARKQSLLGWPWHETTWRGDYPEIRERFADIKAFYTGKMEDPLPWLQKNQVRYVVWVLRDNTPGNAQFEAVREKIRSHYSWTHVGGDDVRLAIGFFERVSE
ncbi:MAG: hypothetical protein KAX37_10330 [Opitutaceae bacterium]|nr:hypothetical protein [Opitutaceae bacterium]